MFPLQGLRGVGPAAASSRWIERIRRFDLERPAKRFPRRHVGFGRLALRPPAASGFPLSDKPAAVAPPHSWRSAGGDNVSGLKAHESAKVADTEGNVYVADAGNHHIRKIMRDGNVRFRSQLAACSRDCAKVTGHPELFWARSPRAVSEAPPSEELGFETLCRGASDTAT